jgi:hypothetical protein
LTLREEHRLRVLGNRVLRRIFGSYTGRKVAWRKIHSEKLHHFLLFTKYEDMNEDEMCGALESMGRMRNVYKTLFGEPEVKRPLESHRNRCMSKECISKETGFEGVV